MASKTPFDLIIVGGGILGLSVAYKFQIAHPDLSILVLEKESDLALHQTGRNSGVIHSGLYYKPGSIKSQTCIDGRNQLIGFAKEFGVPYDLCGKLVVATTEGEIPRLHAIAERAKANGLGDLVQLDPESILEYEPHVRGLKALHVPQTGIVDYRAMVNRLGERMQSIQKNSRIISGQEVLGLKNTDSSVLVETRTAKYIADRVVCCGGLQADRLARADGLNPGIKIVPFRGDYFELVPNARYKVKNLIYPVPDPDLPFLGVHFTRMIDGRIECGPNAVFSFKREGYNRNSFSFRDGWDAVHYRGTRRLFIRHWRYGLGEYSRAYSKRLFLRSLRRLLPDLVSEELMRARSGVRAQAVSRDGKLVDDFVIERGERSVHILNAPSPAATASLAIADRVLTMME